MGSGGTTALLPPDKFFSNLPNFNLKSGADTQSRTGDLTLTKGALYQLSHISTLNLMPGSSLLSHGETPHYHRRYGVSLLSSAWGQVGPPRYSRQTNSCCSVRNILSHQLRWLHSLTSVTYLCMLLPSLHLPPCRCANYCALQSSISAENSLNPPKQLRRCKVKPHGSLVPVSSTHRCAYTPGLSTSSSSTFLQDP